MIEQIFAGMTAVGALITAGGVFIGALQLKASKKQATTSFEDDLDREYRHIVARLPATAFYRDGSAELDDDSQRSFYQYFDLCNDQLFMARQDRIRSETASQWREGITGNLTLPVFRMAWDEISQRVPENFFEDLRLLCPPGRPGIKR